MLKEDVLCGLVHLVFVLIEQWQQSSPKADGMLTGSTQEKMHLLCFSRPEETVYPTVMPWGFVQFTVNWISGLCYFGNENLATVWLQDGLTVRDTVPKKGGR